MKFVSKIKTFQITAKFANCLKLLDDAECSKEHFTLTQMPKNVSISTMEAAEEMTTNLLVSMYATLSASQQQKVKIQYNQRAELCKKVWKSTELAPK